MNKIKLMTHVVVGYPNMEESEKLIKILAEQSDFLELQIPFSDPIADGETIMKASEIALKNGMNTDKAFRFMEELGNYRMPKLVMCYYNQVFRYGVEKFCKRAKMSGVSGLIVPDIPPEEERGEKFMEFCEKYNLDHIRVISPASRVERLKINAKYGKGFVYCVSHFGVTGTKTEFSNNLKKYIERVRKYFSIPVALGFGISSSEQISKIKGLVDIAIVGSAIIKEYDKEGIAGVETFVKSLKADTI